MNKPSQLHDPCQLRDLPQLQAPENLWPEIQAQLLSPAPQPKQAVGWLAMAASLLLGLFLINQFYLNQTDLPTNIEHTIADQPSSTNSNKQTARDSILAENQSRRLLAISQQLEDKISQQRETIGVISASDALIVAELEDMIAVIDKQLGVQTENPELWYRRVALLTDLVTLYQSQKIEEYGQYVVL